MIFVWVWLHSLNMMITSWVHFLANSVTLLFFQLSGIPLCMYHIFPTLSSAVGHLGWLCSLAIVRRMKGATVVIEFPLSWGSLPQINGISSLWKSPSAACKHSLSSVPCFFYPPPSLLPPSMQILEKSISLFKILYIKWRTGLEKVW